MITLSKAPGIMDFSRLCGSLDDPNFPPQVSFLPIGRAIRYEITRLQQLYSKIYIPRYVIMPDHIHLLIYVKERTDQHLGIIIRHFKTNSYQRYWNGEALREQPGVTPSSLFLENFHDRILRREGQLQIMNEYIQDNPRRLMLRREHPEYFQKDVRIRVLIDGKTTDFAVFGNLYLLGDPEKMNVRYRRVYAGYPSQWEAIKKEYRDIIDNSGVLVGPFIHPEEKAWIGNAIENGGKIIKIESNGFRERYKPGRGLIDLCAEGRLLIVAPPEYQPRKKKPDRAECLRMNELAEKLSHPGLQ